MVFRRLRSITTRIAATVVLAVAPGCTKPAPPQPNHASPSPEPREIPPAAGKAPGVVPPVVPAAAAEPMLPPPDGPAAYFVVTPLRLVQLDASGFAAIPIPETMWELQLDHEGTLFAGGFDTVYQLDAGTLRPVTAPLTDGGIQHFFVSSNTDIWATQMAGVFHWNGSEWRHEPLTPVDALKQDFDVVGQPSGILVDNEQRVWLSTARDVMVREGNAWRTLARAAIGGQPRQLWLGPDRAPLLQLASHEFVRLPLGEKDRAKRTSPPRAAGWSERKGEAGAWSVVHVTAGGRRDAYRIGRDIEGVMPIATTADERGRLWVATAAGVTILGEDGARTDWPMGTVAELAGRVDEIAVYRAGPNDVPPRGPLRKGGIRGRLVRDGAPAAGALVELCTHALAITVPPCARSKPRFTATADADGRFEIRELPIGVYSVTVQSFGSWRLLFRPSDPFTVEEGSTRDLGDLDATRGAEASDR